MTEKPSVGEPLYSTLVSDPDLYDLVELFVGEMPNRVSELLERLDANDWDGLSRTAHQLRGAAGSYGFGPISPTAAKVEDAINRNYPEDQIRKYVENLVDMCRRASADVPAG